MTAEQISDKTLPSQQAPDAANAKIAAEILRSETSPGAGNPNPGADLSQNLTSAPIQPDSSLSHLAAVAVSSTWRGFTEPIVGATQLAEQSANALGLKDKSGAAYFNPETLAPVQTKEPTTYSLEWFTKNVGENIGKLPWYLLAARVMRNPGALEGEGEALAAQKLPALGMGLKTAISSGFILGAINPTAIDKNTTLMDSLKERGIQGTIGAGQMALMSGGTELTAGLFSKIGGRVAEQAVLKAPVEPPPLLQSLTAKTVDWSTSFVKKGTIAAVGSAPAGLISGYADAAIHGAKFDPMENIVSTMTLGFGLGGFAPTPKAKFDFLKSIDAPPTAGTAGGATGEVPHIRVEKQPTGRTITYETYADGTRVEHHQPGSIPEFGDSKYTTYPDGRTVLENNQGVYKEFPDGSWERSDSYSTMHSAFGEMPTEWSDLYKKWFKLSSEEKQAAVSDLDRVPPGGNMVGELLERALLSDSDPAVHKIAISQLGNIGSPVEQTQVWNRVWGNYPEYRSQLLDVVPELSGQAQQSIMRSYSSHFDEADNRQMTARKVGSMLEAMNAKTAGEPAETVSSYLQKLAGMPESARRPIFEALDPYLRDPATTSGNDHFDSLVERVRGGLAQNDPLVAKAFGDFWDRPAQSTFATLPETRVERSGLTTMAEDPNVVAHRLDEFKAIFNGKGNLEKEAVQFLERNPQISTLKAIEDWSANQPDKSIQRLVQSLVNFDHLNQRYQSLVKDLDLKSEHDYPARRAPFALMERAARDGVSPERVQKTMQNIVQLLEIGEKFPDMQAAREFKTAAVQAMRQAADPLIITQGAHPTCALASLEMSTYTHAPDAATKFVSEILRTGKFVTTNGTTINIDNLSLKPEERAMEGNRTKYSRVSEAIGYRSYASQVFQTGAANVLWQQRLTTPYNKNFNPPYEKNDVKGRLSFETRTETGEKGEAKHYDQVVDYHTGTRRVWSEGPRITDFNQLKFIANQIEKGTMPTVVLDDAPEIRSRAAFVKYLDGLNDRQFPVIISVDADRIKSPRRTDMVLNHAVSILKSPDGKYLVHNTWRPYSDVHQPGAWIKNNFDLDQLMHIMGVKG